jgi:hypothetical protein
MLLGRVREEVEESLRAFSKRLDDIVAKFESFSKYVRQSQNIPNSK